MTDPAKPRDAAMTLASAADSSKRWADNPYPNYVAEVNASIAFSGADQSFFTEGKAVRLLDVLRRRGLEPSRTSLLDIGCGVGLIHPFLVDSLARIDGVDIAEDALWNAAKQNPRVHYRAYDGSTLPCANGSFDAATTICVMHHVPPARWRAFLAESLRALRPGGVMMVFEHNPYNPLTRLAVARCAFDFDAVLLKPGRLQALMREVGFVDVGREFLFFTPFRALQGAESALRPLPFGAQYVAIGAKPA
jgi:SAM-dependent methyltransferase